ncbi:MAG: Uma2 family endonuclease [Steroidobacteraceae bacterium]
MSAVMQESLPRHHRMTADEYHRMAEVGLLAPDARVELIEGEILEMAPLGNDHLSVVDQLNHLFVHAVGDRAIVRVQGAVRLSQFSEPQPDLVVLKPRADFYRTQGAGPQDVYLIIEASDTTLRYDLHTKVPFYARHEIPEVWVVDLPGGKLHVFRAPKEGSYLDAVVTDDPGTMSLSLLPDVAVDLSHLLRP